MSSPTVTAVIVTEGDTPFFQHTLQAVRNSTKRPDSIVVVDWSSPEAKHHITPDLIRKTKVRAYLVEVLDPLSLGEAIVRALDGLPVDDDYLWILHDDSAPREDALEKLLRGISVKEGVTLLDSHDQGDGKAIEHSSPKPIGIAGTTHYTWGDDLRIHSVGVVVSPHSTRLLDIEPGEIDQGQYSERSDMYAVDTAGMLVQRELWEELDGFSSYTPIYGADIEFCRRAHLAGYRVIVVPDAIVYHAQASLNGIRHKADTLLGRRKASVVHSPTQHSPVLAATARWKSYRARRQAQLFNWAVSLPKWQLPLSGLIFLLLGILRSVFCLLTKNVPGARAEISAAIGYLGKYSDVAKARAASERTRTESHSLLKTLTATPQQPWQHIRRWWSSDTTVQHSEPLDPLAAKQYGIRVQKAHIVTGLLTVIGLVTGLIAMRGWFNPITGGAWATLPQTWSDLWQSAWTTWTVGGDGHGLAADPILGVLALISAPFALFSISPNIVLHGLMILMPCFALLSGWWGFAAISRQIPARFLMALAWMLWPAFLISLWHGNFTAALAHVLLPVFIWGVGYASGFGATDVVSGALSDVGVTSQYRMTTGAGVAALAGAGLMATNLFLGLFAVLVMVVAAIAGHIAYRMKRRRSRHTVPVTSAPEAEAEDAQDNVKDDTATEDTVDARVRADIPHSDDEIAAKAETPHIDSGDDNAPVEMKGKGHAEISSDSDSDSDDDKKIQAENSVDIGDGVSTEKQSQHVTKVFSKTLSSDEEIQIYDPLQLRHFGASGLWLSAFVPVIVAMPTLIGLIKHPEAFLYTLAYTSGAPSQYSTPPYREALFGAPLAISDMPALKGWLVNAWIVFAAALTLLAVYGLMKLYRGFIIRMAWIIAIIGAGATGIVRHVVVMSLPVAESSHIVQLTAWPAVFQSVMWAGIVMAAGASIHRMFTHPLMRFSAMRITASILAICVVTTGIIVGVGWVATSTTMLYSPTKVSDKEPIDVLGDENNNLHPVDRQWPHIVTDDKAASQLAASSGRLSRLLEISPLNEDEVSLRIYRLDAPAITDSSALVSWLHTHHQYDDADTELATAVAAMTRGSAPDADSVLVKHDIEFLITPLCGTPSCQQLEAGLESNKSIERILIGDTNTTWRVIGTKSPIARVRIVDTDETTAVDSQIVDVQTTIEGSSNSRTIELAERYHPGWQAHIDGVRLAAHRSGWQQTFDIPAGAKGKLNITYREPWQWIWWVSSVFAIVISLIGASPIRSRREV